VANSFDGGKFGGAAEGRWPAVDAKRTRVLGGIALLVTEGAKVRTVTLAAGSPQGESYILSTALKKVVERHYPKVRLNVVQTGGTVESLHLMEQERGGLSWRRRRRILRRVPQRKLWHCFMATFSNC